VGSTRQKKERERQSHSYILKEEEGNASNYEKDEKPLSQAILLLQEEEAHNHDWNGFT
jgi:hypothetical protein